MSRPVVLITGASRGIGAATAVFFAIKGWRVAITARTLSEGAQMANQLRLPGGQLLSGSLESTAKAIEAAGGEVFPHVMDLMDLSSLDKAADAVLKRFGRVDLLINNAAVQDLIFKGELMGIKDIMLRSGTEGMQTFDQNLFELYVAGQVDYDEALRQADSANDLRLRIQLYEEGGEPERLFDRISDLNLMS